MTAHVVIDKGAPSTQLGMKCAHCGAKLALALPVAVDEMCAATDAFGERHRKCEPPAAAGATA